MDTITISEWVQIAMLGVPMALAIALVLFRKLGWHKGAMIIEELQAGFVKAQPYIDKARSGDFDISAEVEKASKQLAAAVPGLTDKDVRATVYSLVANKTINKDGVEIKINGDGNVHVDATGFISNKAGKIGKWINKVL